MKRHSDTISNYLDDLTTALPYSDYIRDRVGKYVVVDKKPYIVKGIKFRHTRDSLSTDRILQCFLSVDAVVDDLYLAIHLTEELVERTMDNPIDIIDLINAHLDRRLVFLDKNKVTDLLFKNEP